MHDTPVLFNCLKIWQVGPGEILVMGPPIKMNCKILYYEITRNDHNCMNPYFNIIKYVFFGHVLNIHQSRDITIISLLFRMSGIGSLDQYRPNTDWLGIYRAFGLA